MKTACEKKAEMTSKITIAVNIITEILKTFFILRLLGILYCPVPFFSSQNHD